VRKKKKGSPARYDRGRIFLLFLLCLFGHRFFAFALGSVFFSHIITCPLACGFQPSLAKIRNRLRLSDNLWIAKALSWEEPSQT
jgi:hypothetical protein